MEDVRALPTPAYRHQAGRFADYVGLYGTPGGIILLEQERELLKAGLANFELNLSEATGVLHGTAAARGVSLESQVERHVQTHLTQPRNRRERRLAARGRKPQALTRKRFEQAVDFYQTLTREALPREDARKRVKGIVTRMGLRARREWLRLGSRKWFNGIKDKEPPVPA